MQARALPIEPEIAYQLVTHQSTSSLIRGSAGSPSTYFAAISEKMSHTSERVCSVERVSPISLCLQLFPCWYDPLTSSSFAIRSRVSSTIVLNVGYEVVALLLFG
jgi:hypothetical protein